MDRNYFFEHILTNNIFFFKKNIFSFQYLWTDPLNVLELIVDIIYWKKSFFKQISNYSAHMHNFNISIFNMFQKQLFLVYKL